MSNTINLLKMSLSNLNAIKKMVVFVLIFFIPASIINPTMLSMLIGVIVLNLSQQVMACEDMNGIDYLISYMPVTRKEYVISRYLLGLLATLVGTGVFIICYYIARKYSPTSDQLFDYNLALSIGVTSAILAFSITIPSTLKFGYVKGRTLSTFLMIFIVMTPSFMLGALSENEIFMDIVVKLNSLNIGFIFFVINIIIVLLSYTITKNIYLKKEIL